MKRQQRDKLTTEANKKRVLKLKKKAKIQKWFNDHNTFDVKPFPAGPRIKSGHSAPSAKRAPKNTKNKYSLSWLDRQRIATMTPKEKKYFLRGLTR